MSDTTSAPACARCFGRGVIPTEATTLAYICDHCEGSGIPVNYWPRLWWRASRNPPARG